MKISKQQNNKIWAILPNHYKIDANLRADLVRQFTNDYHKSSMADLSFDEGNMLLKSLGHSAISYDNWAFYDKDNAQHRKVLSTLYTLGWTKNTLPDLVRLSEWLKSEKSPVPKPLNDMNPKQVSRIIYVLEKMTLTPQS